MASPPFEVAREMPNSTPQNGGWAILFRNSVRPNSSGSAGVHVRVVLFYRGFGLLHVKPKELAQLFDGACQHTEGMPLAVARSMISCA